MTEQKTAALDRVCGMTVKVAHAREAGLTTEHEGVSYYFCGKGCKLDFQADAATYLDPGYKPSMPRLALRRLIGLFARSGRRQP